MNNPIDFINDLMACSLSYEEAVKAWEEYQEKIKVGF